MTFLAPRLGFLLYHLHHGGSFAAWDAGNYSDAETEQVSRRQITNLDGRSLSVQRDLGTVLENCAAHQTVFVRITKRTVAALSAASRSANYSGQSSTNLSYDSSFDNLNKLVSRVQKK